MKENMIPDYDFLFEKDKENQKEKTHFIKKIIKKDFGKILLSTIMYIIKSSPVWIIPLITSEIITLITEKPDNINTMLIFYGVLLFILIAQNVLTHVLYAKITDKMIRSTSNGIRLTVVRKLQHLSITYHKEMETGTIQSKFLSDIDKIDNYYASIIKIIIPAIIGVIISVGISIYRSPLVTLFFLLIIPLNLISGQLFKKRMRSSNKDLRIENEAMSARISNMIQMLSLIKSHGLETIETIEAKKAIDRVTVKSLKADRDIAYFGSTAWVVSQCLSVVSLIFTAFLALKGYITVGDVVLFQSLFAQINGSVSTLINYYPQIVSGNESIESISEIVTNEELEDRSGNREPKNVIGYVDFNHVYYKYPDAFEYQLKDIDLHVRKGECIALVGSSGSGKSTIMSLLLGLIDPSEGTLDIDGVPMTELSKIVYRKFVSVVPQNCILFPGSIKENITYGLESYTEEELNEAVEASNIKEFLPSMKYGLDTNVGEHGDKLSGGQKQRVAIARALIRKPRILILDEATSALDNESEYHIEKAIERMTKTCTTFIVAHRLSTIRNADRIVVIEEGKIEEIGTYKELIDKKGKFFELDKLSRLSDKRNETIGE